MYKFATTRCIAAAAALSALVVHTSQASALSLSVEIACAADYYSYCSKHDPEGPGVRKCMRDNGQNLSMRCLNALVGAGEVSKAEIESRSAKK